MKKYIFAIAILACLSSLSVAAQTNQKSIFTETENILKRYETNQMGIVSRSYPMAIAYTPWGGIHQGWISAKEFDSGKPIYFEVYSITNRPRPLVFFFLKPQYAFKISAVSENGEMVKPTRQGAKYGVGFDPLKAFDADYIDKTGRRNPYWTTTGSLNSMPTPDELFNFSKPGKYIMTIEAACFATYDFLPRYNSTNYFLVKFPPVKFQVIKKDDQK